MLPAQPAANLRISSPCPAPAPAQPRLGISHLSIFACPPSWQAVTGYRLEVAGVGELTSIRDAFVAATGAVLLSADYSQARAGGGPVHCISRVLRC